MPHKIETLYKKIVGRDPNNMEPKPSRMRMATEIAGHRDGTFAADQEILFADSLHRSVKSFKLFASGVDAKGELWTLISRQMIDGSIQFSYIFGQAVEETEVSNIAALIPKGNWFSDEELLSKR